MSEKGEREHAIAALTLYLHGEEHGGNYALGFDSCDTTWHTESWFTHVATEAYDSGSGGR